MKNLLSVAISLLIFVSCKKEKTYRADDIIGKYEYTVTISEQTIKRYADSASNVDTVINRTHSDTITIKQPNPGPYRYTYFLFGGFQYPHITLPEVLEDRIYYFPDSTFTYNPATNEINQLYNEVHEFSDPSTGSYSYYHYRMHIYCRKIKE